MPGIISDFWSPSELVRYFESPFAAWMDRWYKEVAGGEPTTFHFNGLEIPDCQPNGPDKEMEILAQKGIAQEQTILKGFQEVGKRVVLIPRPSALDVTKEVMKSGADVIYQPLLKDGTFQGYADFLVRVDSTQNPVGYLYEIWDSKLALTPRPSFVLQLCAYSEMLGKLQGSLPRNFVLALGNGEQKTFPLKQFFHLYKHIKKDFLAFHEAFDLAVPIHPGDCSFLGNWSDVGEKILEELDHLSLVANITRGQIRKLNQAGIGSVHELAGTDLTYIPKLPPAVFDRVREQADLQVRSRDLETPLFRVVPPPSEDLRKGFALLPPPSRLDVFFDIEGYPLVEGGLEYLLGAVTVEDGKTLFHDWWAHDAHQEKTSFESYIDWVHARWREDPTMHIFHYAHYEITAMKRLMGTYATREDKVDDLLRNQVFVDLYKVVRQGLLIGTPSYSLKQVEHLYHDKREGDVVTAEASIIAYHNWIQSGQSQKWEESPILKEIRDYNDEDCVSTYEFARWLWKRQTQENIPWVSPFDDDAATKADSGIDQEEPSPFELRRIQRRELAQRLMDEGAALSGEEGRILSLLGQLTEFHWREAKPVFWKRFDRASKTDMELFYDPDCLACLNRTDEAPRPEKRSQLYAYNFDPDQETKIVEKGYCFLAQDLGVKYQVFSLDRENGRIEIKLGNNKPAPPGQMNLIPDEYVSADIIEDRLRDLGQRCLEGKTLYPALSDLLERQPPRLMTGSFLFDETEGLEGILRLARDLNSSTLCIQGPPGAGKTFTGGHIIADLLSMGKRVGITATGHKTILNLMESVQKVLDERGKSFTLYKVGGPQTGSLFDSGKMKYLKNNGEISFCLNQLGPFVVGATAWGFSRPEMEQTLDYLFIDEGGQFSLANALAVGRVADNIVLLGDQMQLSQPIQGSHPGDSGLSCLEYLLQGQETIPADLGVFLGETWRMHPDLCGFISQAFYDGRLKSHLGLEKQKILIPESTGVENNFPENGILFVPVEHEGNGQASDEEAEIIEQIVQVLLKGIFRNEDGIESPLGMEDILLVAPYNMQVRKLKRILGPTARVGSVDIFQGQEAPVVILSMCSSSREESSRGLEFLCDPHRINVALSRVRSLAIVVGSPSLLKGKFANLKEMELANLYAWIIAEGMPKSYSL